MKGDPRAGRKKGSKNKATIEVREAARKLVEDEGYRKALKLRLTLGEAGPVEAMLWHYAYGKPPDKVELTGRNGEPLLDQSRAMTSEEARRRMAELAAAAASRMGAGEPTGPEKP